MVVLLDNGKEEKIIELLVTVEENNIIKVSFVDKQKSFEKDLLLEVK
jgi:hypothetical protein